MDFDYIIVGAGSAGCVLANRLTANGRYRVLLIEAGGKDRHLLIKMPSALSYPMAMKKYNWGYWSDPEPHINNRRITCPRGRGLGGTSTINGMVYVRGNRADFDQWSSLGAKGWAYQDCLPYFKRAETWQGGADDYRGGEGPLKTCNGNNMRNPLYKAFIDAGVEAGYPYTADYNGAEQEGFGPMHMTVDRGHRCSTAAAYLRPAQGRRNLTVFKHCYVERLLIKNRTVEGVIVQHKHKRKLIRANKEVILSAGAIASPMLLQHSGIGPAHVLQNTGKQVLHDMPGVGQNLQDHLEVYFQYHCKQALSLNNKFNWRSKLTIGAQWLLFRKGLGATNHYESCGFIKSSNQQPSPDIQYHFLPAAVRYDGSSPIDGHGFQVHVGPNKPVSRGRVNIISKNPKDAPSILFNYLQAQQDIEAWRNTIRITRKVMAQPAMAAYCGEPIQPSNNIDSDEAIDAWVRENVESAYHPCGTCKMGDDTMAVVDTACKLIGFDGIRIVDASIFPNITNGNLNAPTIMVAEKAADIILETA